MLPGSRVRAALGPHCSLVTGARSGLLESQSCRQSWCPRHSRGHRDWAVAPAREWEGRLEHILHAAAASGGAWGGFAAAAAALCVAAAAAPASSPARRHRQRLVRQQWQGCSRGVPQRPGVLPPLLPNPAPLHVAWRPRLDFSRSRGRAPGGDTIGGVTPRPS